MVSEIGNLKKRFRSQAVIILYTRVQVDPCKSQIEKILSKNGPKFQKNDMFLK
jgi:hypothetical protein